MIEGALDEAEQQDALGKRAGQSFKSEALLLIATAAAERADPELNITLTIAPGFRNDRWKIDIDRHRHVDGCR
jgi:hypothetical protein